MPTVIDDETLVAYLDGELPAEQITVVEKGLNSDEQLRLRLQKLQAAWDLLAELPEETPNPDLARSTIEMVTIAFERESKSWWIKLMKRRWLAIGIASLLMLGAGAAAGTSVSRLAESKLLVELQVIVAMPSLENIDSVEWLDCLASMPNLVEAGNFLVEHFRVNGGPGMIGETLVPQTIRQREKWVENLSDSDRGILQDFVQEFFFKTPEERQHELRIVTAHIFENRDQVTRLVETLRAYHALLDDRNTPYITQLMGKSIEQRQKIVEQLIAGVMCQKYATIMSPSDKDALDFWLWDLQVKTDSILGPEDFGESVIQELSSGLSTGSFIDSGSLSSLVKGGENALSPQAASLLNNVEDENDRRGYLGLWVMSVLPGRQAVVGASATNERLQQEFERLKLEERNKLELMPERDARNELERRFRLQASPENTSSRSSPRNR